MALYNLGFFNNSISNMVTEDGFILSKEIVDKEIKIKGSI